MTIPKSYEALTADLASEKILSKTLLGQKEAYMMLADKGGLDLSESKAREAALREELDRFKRDAEQDTTIDERDRYHEIADSLAMAISKHFRVEIGEHSSMNCPWGVALDVMNGAYITDTNEGRERDALQQRLTVAEQREAEAREELLELSRKLDVFYSRSHGIKNLSEIEKANDKAKDLKLKVCEYEVLLNISKELLTTISRHGATTKPVDWCDSFKAEVADRIEKIGAALKPAEGEGS